MVSCRGLAKRLDASYGTVRRAFQILAAEGRLKLEYGRGTFVAPTPRSRQKSAKASRARTPSALRIWALAYGGTGGLSGDGCGGAVYNGVSDAVLEARDSLLLSGGPPRPEQLCRAGVSGALLYGEHWRIEQSRYARSPLPVVVIDDIPVIRGMDYVVADNQKGSELIVDRLVAMGHRRFAFIQSMVRRSENLSDLHPDADSEARARFTRAALRRRGLSLPSKNIIQNYGGRARKREPAAHTFLTLKPRPTAVITSGEDRAVTLMRVLKQKGVRVPAEVSIATFNTAGSSQSIPVSGVEIEFEEMGRAGFERLRARVAGTVPKGASRRILVPVSLVEGATWGPVASK